MLNLRLEKHILASHADWGYKFTVVATSEAANANASVTTADLEAACSAVSELVLYGTRLPDDVVRTFTLPPTSKPESLAMVR